MCSIVCVNSILLVVISIFVVESIVVITKAKSEISAFVLDGQCVLKKCMGSVLVLILHTAVCFFVVAICVFFVTSFKVIFFLLKFADINDSHRVSGGSLNRVKGLDPVGCGLGLRGIESGFEDSAL